MVGTSLDLGRLSGNLALKCPNVQTKLHIETCSKPGERIGALSLFVKSVAKKI